MALDEPDHHIGAALLAPLGLLEHGEGLADAGGGTEIDPQLSTCHRQILPRPWTPILDWPRYAMRFMRHQSKIDAGGHPARPVSPSSRSSARLSSRTFTARLTDEAQRPAGRVVLDQLLHDTEIDASLARHPRRLQVRVRDADVRVEAAGARGHRVGGHGRVRRGVAPDGREHTALSSPRRTSRTPR